MDIIYKLCLGRGGGGKKVPFGIIKLGEKLIPCSKALTLTIYSIRTISSKVESYLPPLENFAR